MHGVGGRPVDQGTPSLSVQGAPSFPWHTRGERFLAEPRPWPPPQGLNTTSERKPEELHYILEAN